MAQQFRQNELCIEKCGIDFVNGVYIRTEQNQFIKQCIHPYSNKIINLEIRKHTDSDSLSIPTGLYNDDDEIYNFMHQSINTLLFMH